MGLVPYSPDCPPELPWAGLPLTQPHVSAPEPPPVSPVLQECTCAHLGNPGWRSASPGVCCPSPQTVPSLSPQYCSRGDTSDPGHSTALWLSPSSLSRVPWVLPFVSQFHPDRLGSLALEAFVAKFLNPCFSMMSVRSRNLPEFSNMFGWLAACLPALHLWLVLCVPLTFNGPLGTLGTVCSVPCAEPFS